MAHLPITRGHGVKHNVLHRPDGSRWYTVWVGSNYIVVQASPSGVIALTEFAVSFATITTALDVDDVAKNIIAYIAANRTTFRDLSDSEWQDVGHTGVVSTRKPKPVVTQKAMF
jgi:hypothetical protein